MTPMWDTPEGRRELLEQLVGWDSVTGSGGERGFAERVAGKLRDVPGLAVALHEVDGGRSIVTALHRVEGVADTIVLISHFDTVDTADYGALQPLAGSPAELADALRANAADLDDETARDLASGEWMFGRGSMDLKAGLMLHMSLVEQARADGWPINLVLLTVPDEEVNSAGMRAAVPLLRTLEREHELRYVLFLNGEPSFPAHPGDESHYVYSGSIGKLLPSALCVGRETHAGTPLSGITSSWIAAHLTEAMEWSDAFRETSHGEPTPLPVTLDQRDLRDGYSTQTPFRTSALYNVFVMERGAGDVLAAFERVARDAAERCERHYRTICEREGVEPIGGIRVLRFEQLVEHAVERRGRDGVDALVAAELARDIVDLRERSIAIADALVRACPELAPAIVLLFAPPYYPPANSSDDPLVASCIERVIEQARARFGRELVQAHWFNGISDLSYVGRAGEPADWATYERNTPGFGTTYAVPFADIEALDAPVLNVGPLGKDPHQRTERVHAASAFEEVPALLADLVAWIAARA
jgi:arginine utilization protein RocB